MQKQWRICLVALGLFFIYNLLTMSKMFAYDCPKEYSPNIRKEEEIAIPKTLPSQACDTQLLNVNTRLNVNLGRWDNLRMYKIFDNVFIGEKKIDYDVCLATQSSLERLASLVQVVAHWGGPMSVSVFVVGEELSLAITFIGYLRKCFPLIKDLVYFHIVFPRNDQPKSISINDDYKADCRNPRATLASLIRNRIGAMKQWKRKNPYPQNHLRNVARKNCQSQHVLVTDIDIIPSMNMGTNLNNFLKTSGKQKHAYVIPTYELDIRVEFPANKSELLRLVRKNLARPFHEKVFIFNQYATNLTRWQNIRKESDKVHISYPVTNFEFFYEPFYVSSDNVPPHDERFLGYGFTRNTQTYETFLAGYKFFVLSPIFACHWGLQSRKGRPFWRETQNAINQKLFDTFKKEVTVRYNRDPFNMVKGLIKL